MEQPGRRIEQVTRIAAAITLALGACAVATGCAEKPHPTSTAPSRIDANTLPTGPPLQGLPRCTYEGTAPNSIVARINQNDVATAFNLDTRELVGTSEQFTVTCDHPIDARGYPKITVPDLAGTYSNEGHCVLVSNMPDVAECVQTTR